MIINSIMEKICAENLKFYFLARKIVLVNLRIDSFISKWARKTFAIACSYMALKLKRFQQMTEAIFLKIQ